MRVRCNSHCNVRALLAIVHCQADFDRLAVGHFVIPNRLFGEESQVVERRFGGDTTGSPGVPTGKVNCQELDDNVIATKTGGMTSTTAQFILPISA